MLLHRLKPSTTTLFLFILDLYLQQPVCSFVSAWLHCFFVRLLHWVAHWGRLHHPVQKCLMLLLNSLPPSPQTGAPPLRRGLSCGPRSELLPVNKINHGRHQRTKRRGRTSGFHSCDAAASTWGAFYHLDGVSVTLALFRGKQLKNEMDIPATRVLFKTCHWFDHVFWILTLDKPTVSCLICTRLSRGQVVMKITLNISVDSALWVLLLVNNWSIFPFLPSISTLLDGVSTPWIVRISFQACVSLFHN